MNMIQTKGKNILVHRRSPVTTLKEMLRATSRTFALGIERLPGTLGTSVMIAYLLLRVSDYFEDDDNLSNVDKLYLLEAWDSILAGHGDITQLVARITQPDGSNPDKMVALHAAQVLEGLNALPSIVQSIIVRNVRDTTRGMAKWIECGPLFEDECDLDSYMYEVAGRVGYLLTELFAWHSSYIRLRREALMPLAREFGLALQTVNVIRGLHEDFDRGWIYIPNSYCSPLQIEREELFQPDKLSVAMQVLLKLADKADRHLDSAMNYLKALPPWQYGIRLFCVYPLMFAVRTLAVSRHNREVWSGEVKISRKEVFRIVRDTTLWSWSNAWLDNYYQKLRTISASPIGSPDHFV
jgi:farnesyl-diphosphate farnesyltransferase